MFFDALDGVLLASGLSLPQAPHASLNALYVTHDGGTSWQLSATVPGDVSYADFLDVNHAWLTDRTTLYSTGDGGHHWTTIHPQGMTQGALEYISFVSPDLGWAVERLGTDARDLARTTDGGRTWRSVHYGVEA